MRARVAISQGLWAQSPRLARPLVPLAVPSALSVCPHAATFPGTGVCLCLRPSVRAGAPFLRCGVAGDAD